MENNKIQLGANLDSEAMETTTQVASMAQKYKLLVKLYMEAQEEIKNLKALTEPDVPTVETPE